jgi:23S rRNA-/tRNA-specific pseudouridylate synthase
MSKKYKVEKDYHNTRFDRWFKALVIDLPQSLIEKIIRKNKVKVNNQKTKTSYRVQMGDVVEIFDFSKLKIKINKKKLNINPLRKKQIIMTNL